MDLELSDAAKAVLIAKAPVLVLGGPGSGKTTLSLLKSQTLLGGLKPEQEILFLSFSRAAVRQVEIRCKDILRADDRSQIAVRTYHAFAMDILRSHGRLLTGLQPRIIYPGDAMVAKAAFEGEWAVEIARLAGEEGRYAFQQFASAAATLLENSAAISELLANKFPILILDEFQDTDDAQWSLVKQLSARSSIIVLADPDQRIFDYDDRVDPARLDQLREFIHPSEFDLSGENHRSPDAGILQYANALMRNQPLPKTSDVICTSYYANAFEATVHAAVVWMYSELRKAGVSHPTVTVLTRTNSLVSTVSAILSTEHTLNNVKLKPIDHDVLWDAERTAAAALVVASILEWPQRSKDESLGRTFERIADYFEIKNAANSSDSSKRLVVQYRVAAQKARETDHQRSKSAKALELAFDAGLDLRGEVARDWVAARELLTSGKDFASLLADAKFVRLFRATDEIGGRLASEWDRRGTYGNATDLVRRALDAGKILSNQRDPRGCVLMTIHKAKGKEFDGVVLVEGQWQGQFFDSKREQPPFAATRRLLRVAVTRARHRVTIVRPVGAQPFVSSFVDAGTAGGI